MQHGVRLMLPECIAHCRGVANVDRNDGHVFAYGGTMALRQVVDDDNIVAAVTQPSHGNASDVPGPAGDENLHARSPWVASEIAL